MKQSPAAALNSLDTAGERPFKVLVLSRSYPNSVMDVLGLWVESVTHYSRLFCEPKVISPVPYCPPFPAMPQNFRKYRDVERHGLRGGVEVFYPRLLVGPGYFSYNYEWMLYYASIRTLVEGLRRSFPFDLIHANFTYPDGVAGVHLGRHYNVPVVITEHVPWNIWDAHPRVLQRAAWAAQQCAIHISVSESAKKTVEAVIGVNANLRVIPNGVDGSVFRPPASPAAKLRNQVLFAGAVRPIKGIDVLLQSIRLLREQGRDVTLVIAGAAYYGKYQVEERRLRQMARELGLADHVTFAGKKSPQELVACMQQSAVLVLPSRAESFGVVLVEALACGIPVVATCCGGPEDIVNNEVGVLVPTENHEALAQGLAHVLDDQNTYDPSRLRAYALARFSLENVGRQIRKVYEEAVKRHEQPTAGEAVVASGGASAD